MDAGRVRELHPCFGAKKNRGRIHLPVCPGCNLECHFCARKINEEEQRPGVTARVITPAEAVEEANFILDYTKDWELDFPIVYDWEYISGDARTANVDSETLTACTAAFCHTVENAGHEAMIYFNPHQAHKKFDLEELTDYGFWLALYADQMDYPYKVDMWQYSESGTVPGIEGPVDLNLYFPYDNA